MDLPFVVVMFMFLSFGIPAVFWIISGMILILSKLFGGEH